MLLIPLVAVIVTAIAYDFSVKEMSRDSMVLLEKAKVHLLNLGDEEQLKKLEEQKKANEQLTKVKATLPVKTTAKPNVKTIEAKPELIKVEKENNTKVEIANIELTEKQELQLKTIQEQIAKNTQLTKQLNTISEQLVLEQTKNEALNSRLAAQEKDRLELEFELYNMLEKSENSLASIDEQASITNQTIKLQSPPTDVAIKTEVIETKTEVKIVMKDKETQKIEALEKSDTDKIIEAMATVDTSVKTIKETEKPIEVETKVANNVVMIYKDELTIIKKPALTNANPIKKQEAKTKKPKNEAVKTAKTEVITDEVLSVKKPKAELIKVAIKPVEKEPEVAQKPTAPAVAKEKNK